MLNKNTLSLTFAAAMVFVVGCSNYEEPSFDPRGLGTIQRAGTADQATRPMRPLPTTLESPYLQSSTRPSGLNTATTPPTSRPNPEPARLPLDEGAGSLRVSLREVAQRAVANNLNVRVSGFTPAIEETRVTEAEARFDPLVFSNLTYTKQTPNSLFDSNPGVYVDQSVPFGSPAGALESGGTETVESVQAALGLRQTTQNGGQVELSWRPGWVGPYGGTNSQGETVGNGYQSEVNIQITQPLFRDYGQGVNRARIVINKNNQRVSILDFRRDLEDLLRQVEQTYWQLVQAEREVLIQEELLQRTQDTAKLLSDRLGQDVTRVQISQANASVELRRSDLIRSRQQVRNLSDQLKGFLNDPDYAITSSTLLLAETVPLEQPLQFDLKDLVDTGLLNRYELGQQQIRVDSASVALEVAKNNKLPVFNVIASGGLSAVGENTLFESTFQEDYRPTWSLGFQFEYPLGNRAAQAIYVRSQLQRLQAIEQYRALIDQVSLDIKVAKREVDTSWEEIVQTRKARFANADALNSLQIREDAAEPLTPTFVQLKLDQQDRLAIAARQEAAAISNYNIAISRLEFAKGTLLRYNNVILDEKALPGRR